MFLQTSQHKPVAYVGALREEDVPDLMHQLYEPVYGARVEGVPSPFLWGPNLMCVMAQAALKGFEAVLVQ